MMMGQLLAFGGVAGACSQNRPFVASSEQSYRLVPRQGQEDRAIS